MSDYSIRRREHYDLMHQMDAELRGVIDAAGEAVDAGRITPGQALARIREKATQTQAAIDASWADLLGGAQ